MTYPWQTDRQKVFRYRWYFPDMFVCFNMTCDGYSHYFLIIVMMMMIIITIIFQLTETYVVFEQFSCFNSHFPIRIFRNLNEADSNRKSEGSIRVNTRRRIFREKRKLAISLANIYVYTGQATLSARLGDILSILIAPLTQIEQKTSLVWPGVNTKHRTQNLLNSLAIG